MEGSGDSEGGDLCFCPRSAAESWDSFPRFTLLSVPMQGFLQTKGIPTNGLIIQDKIWQREFCFLTDITVYMNEINLKFEGKRERVLVA